MGAINMKKFTVTMAREETRVWQFTVSAKNADDAEEKVQKLWDDEKYGGDGRVVHAEEFVNQVEAV